MVPQPRYDATNVPRFADGANTDNSAIVPLVLRGVKNIISVLSNEFSIDVANGVLANVELARLFGLTHDNIGFIDSTDGFVSVPIFDNTGDQYNMILQGLRNAQGEQKTLPSIFTCELTTVQNASIGLVRGVTHTMTFVFLARCHAFTTYLRDMNSELADNVADDVEFPHYATIGEDIFHGGAFLYQPHQARKLALLGQFYASNSSENSIDRIIRTW